MIRSMSWWTWWTVLAVLAPADCELIVPGPDSCPQDTKYCITTSGHERCLRKEFVCYGRKHCHNASEERNCTECKWGAFWCGDRCMANITRCDGYEQCSDGSDEADCSDEVDALSRDQELSTCRGGTIRRKAARCDGYQDCPDHDDEENCTRGLCQGGSFWCDAHCRSKSHLCDGWTVCSNGIDEMDCQFTAPATTKKFLVLDSWLLLLAGVAATSFVFSLIGAAIMFSLCKLRRGPTNRPQPAYRGDTEEQDTQCEGTPLYEVPVQPMRSPATLAPGACPAYATTYVGPMYISLVK